MMEEGRGNNPPPPSQKLVEVIRQVLASAANKEGDARMDILAWMLRDPLRTCLQGLVETAWFCTRNKEGGAGDGESGEHLLSPQDKHAAVQSAASRKIVAQGNLSRFDISKLLWALLDREDLPLLTGLKQWLEKKNKANPVHGQTGPGVEEVKTLGLLLEKLRELRDLVLHPSEWSVSIADFTNACSLISNFLVSTEGIMAACSSAGLEIARRKFSDEFRLGAAFGQADRMRLQRSDAGRVEFLPGDLDGQFVGREDYLNSLFSNTTADAASASAWSFELLVGLGGSGKTRIAVEYARKFGGLGKTDQQQQQHDDDDDGTADRYPGGVVMLCAQSSETLAQSLFDFVKSCFATGFEHEQLWTKDIESDQFETICTRAWSHVSCWLRDCREANSRWLLIFDAAEDPDMLMALPLWKDLVEMKYGHVLVTSSCAQNWPFGRPHLVRGLNEADAMKLLLRHSGARINTPTVPQDTTEKEKKALSCIVGPVMLNGMPSALLKAARYLLRRKQCKESTTPFQQLFCAFLRDPSSVLGWSSTELGSSSSPHEFAEHLTVWKFLHLIGLKRLADKVRKAKENMTVNELLKIQDPGDQVEHLIKAKVDSRFDRATILDRILAHHKLVRQWTTAVDRMQGTARLLLHLRSFLHPFKKPDETWLYARLSRYCMTCSQVSESDFNNACHALQQRSLLTKKFEMEPLVQTYVRTQLSEHETQRILSALDWPLRQPDAEEKDTVLDLYRTCELCQSFSEPLVTFDDPGSSPNVWFQLQHAELLCAPQSRSTARPSKRRAAPTNPVAKMGKPSPN